MRKTMIAIAAAVALGTATMATGAMAAPHGGGHWGGAHFGGGHWGGHWGGGFVGPGIGLYAYGGPWYPGGCWVHRRVWTPFGWRWRLVEVC